MEKTVRKEVEIEAQQVSSKKIPISVELFTVFRHAKDGEFLVFSGTRNLPAVDKASCFFQEEATGGRYRYVYFAEQGERGEKIIGWIARAYSDDGIIVGAAGSSQKYIDMAKDPKKFAEHFDIAQVKE